MAYDLESIKNKISQLSSNGRNFGGKDKKGGFEKAKRLTYFKPPVGETTDVRFMPYDDGNGQPIHEVSYYDSRKLTPRRIVAPAQWGKPDPISDLYLSLSKERQSPAVFKLMKELKQKPSWYALVLVRGQEDKGIQVWELNKNQVMSIYGLLAHPDYAEENLMDPETGYDISINVTKVGEVEVGNKMFDKKRYDFAVRRKPSALAKTKVERDKLVAQLFNVGEYFGQFCMNEDKLKDIVTSFLTELDGPTTTGDESSVVGSDSDSDGEDDIDFSSKDAEDKISNAFKGL